MRELLAAEGSPADVVVESASIGPAFVGPHDARVQNAAAQLGLPLAPRVPKVFDEVRAVAPCPCAAFGLHKY